MSDQLNGTGAINTGNGHGNRRSNRVYLERRRIPANDLVNQIGADGNPRFGVVRDRLFHAMLVRLSVPYTSVPLPMRRFVEFITLVNAVTLLTLLIYTHFLVGNYPAQCLEPFKQSWPRKGIVRVEVIRNLEEFREMQLRRESVSSSLSCHFDLAAILREGKLPAEIRRYKNRDSKVSSSPGQSTMERQKVERPMPVWVEALLWLLDQFQFSLDEEKGENGKELERRERRDGPLDEDDYDLTEDEEFLRQMPFYHNLFEFSLHYGLLRLSAEMRHELNVEVLVVQLDVEKDECFSDWKRRPLMRYLVGLDELVMASVKQLSENETERGYLRDLGGSELYHFVSFGPPSANHYLTALIVMLIFTFAISMLLRFSHDQIFVFIVDLFQMFEQNQPLIFPIAPLLTVILALVGMEAIMSEIFNDTSTAFYVILLVWMADQFDAIFCHSPIARRYWLRFFYLYHFAFYAYQYRYNGLYSGLAMLTSAAFTLHSMIFFFHHYELPFITYQEELVTAVQHLQNTEGLDGTVEIVRIRGISAAQRSSFTDNIGEPIHIERIHDRLLRVVLSAILGNRLFTNNTRPVGGGQASITPSPGQFGHIHFIIRAEAVPGR